LNRTSNHITLSALFTALGVVLPAAFHAVGLGKAVLPMFWPVAAAGFMLPFVPAVFVAVLTPVLSFILTGMPPVSPPVLHVMVIELICLVTAMTLLMRFTRWGLFWVLLAALVFSRTALFFSSRMLAPVLGLPAKWISLASVLNGLPGIAMMLAMIPTLIGRLTRQAVWKARKKSAQRT
jgi:niacin transporter